MEGRYFSAKKLASFGIKRLPRSERGMHNIARREQWPSRTVPGGGGRSGTLTEYQPPPEVQQQIDEQLLAGEGAPTSGTAAAAGEPARAPAVLESPAGQIEVNLLATISMKLERGYLLSPLCVHGFMNFFRDHGEAVLEFSESLLEPKAPEDVRVGALKHALDDAWMGHVRLHAYIAAGIYNKAIRVLDPDKRSRLIANEVREFIEGSELMVRMGRPEQG